jgi:hypothetical protein
MLPEIVTDEEAKTYRAALASPAGVYFVTNENEDESKDELKQRAEGKANGDSDESGISGPGEATV